MSTVPLPAPETTGPLMNVRQMLRSMPITTSAVIRYGGHFLIYPINSTLTRMGLQDPNFYRNYRSVAGNVKTSMSGVHNDFGIRGLYKGFGVSVLGVFIYRAALCKTYDFFGPKFMPGGKNANVLLKLMFIHGSTSVAALMAYPYEAIRQRMIHQTEIGISNLGIGQTFRTILREEGIRGLFRGSISNCLKGTAGALSIVLFDELVKYYTEY
mmetsp:Transcript_48205/g.55502  ORF Transcript_48205/g.55502 Transcript_48205/m.55502 type:complete len:212 (-) Transcript_48205:202-837(-)